jgi:hypothetical protein
MYAVVGCRECAALWVVEGRPETTTCPRCGTRRQHAKRRRFLTTDDADHAREARTALLAERQGHEAAYEKLDSFAELAAAIDEASPGDEASLEGSGLDPEAVAAAGERAGEGVGGTKNREATIRAALRDLEEPTQATVVAYADEYGVSEADTVQALGKLVSGGAVIENRGTYRLVE